MTYMHMHMPHAPCNDVHAHAHARACACVHVHESGARAASRKYSSYRKPHLARAARRMRAKQAVSTASAEHDRAAARAAKRAVSTASVEHDKWRAARAARAKRAVSTASAEHGGRRAARRARAARAKQCAPLYRKQRLRLPHSLSQHEVNTQGRDRDTPCHRGSPRRRQRRRRARLKVDRAEAQPVVGSRCLRHLGAWPPPSQAKMHRTWLRF